MRFVGVGARAASDEGGESECWSITDRIGRWTVSTIEPVTMRAARLVTRPELHHDKRTPE